MYLFGIVFECWSGFLAFTRERSREEAAFSLKSTVTLVLLAELVQIFVQ